VPGYPELPPPDAPPGALFAVLADLTRYARQLPRDIADKLLYQMLEHDFLFCLDRLENVNGGRVEPLDDGTPVVDLPTVFVQAVPPVPFAGVECALISFGHEPFYATFDAASGVREIRHGILSAPMYFVTKTTSMFYDEGRGRLWVAGDFRVIGLNVEHFEEQDLLYVGNPMAPEDVPIWASCLTIWTDLVTLGHGRALTFWMGDGNSLDVPGWDWAEEGEGEDEDEGIVRRRGRSRCESFEIDTEIGQVCTAGDFLVVASNDLPIIRIYRRVLAFGPLAIHAIFRLIGHTGGITRLVSRMRPDGRELISSSRDGTVKLWNLETREQQFTFRHVPVEASSDDSLSFILSGEDGEVIRLEIV
jgi:hypothetical protein